MATPTSHPRPSPSKPSNHLTPASASSPPAPPSSHSGATRSISSPIHHNSNHAAKRSLNVQNGHARGLSGGSGGTPMARTGTNTSAQGGAQMARTATNGSAAATPMARTATTMSMDSPAVVAAAAMLMEGMPRGLGLTPQGMGTGLTPLGLQLGGHGGSSVGGIAGMAAQDQEEARRRRIEVIVGMVGGRWGFVGQEGVERCAKRLGLECLWEEGMGVLEERKRVLSIAGHGVLIEVNFEDDVIVDVVLSLPGCADGQGDHVADGSRILKRDLKGKDDDIGYVLLDHFASNLESLARMDRLGGESATCFNAVDGVYRSLRRVYDLELATLRSRNHLSPENEVACLLSGRPFRNARGRIGLACQYWIEQRRSLKADAKPQSKTEEDVSIWSTIIECEACSADIYPPIRISNDWVSESVEKPATQEPNELHISSTNIDWLEVPATTQISSKDPSNTLSEDNEASKVPDIRFVAKFEPPLNLPLQTALQLHETLGAPIPQNTILPTTYEALLFAAPDINPLLPIPPTNNPRTVTNAVTSYFPDTNETPTTNTHKYTLYTQPQDFARTITDLPFKHPMQLIELLPTFRQWALIGSILKRSFTPQTHPQSPISNPSNTTNNNNNIETDPQADPPAKRPTFQTLEDELAAFLSSSPTTNNNNNTTTTTSSNTTNSSSSKPPLSIAVDITFTTTPLPRFTIHFPNPRFGGKLASVGFSVGLNGLIEGVDVDDGGPGAGAGAGTGAGLGGSVGGGGPGDGGEEVSEREKERVALREQVRRVLEIGEDVGVCVEWMVRG